MAETLKETRLESDIARDYRKLSEDEKRRKEDTYLDRINEDRYYRTDDRFFDRRINRERDYRMPLRREAIIKGIKEISDNPDDVGRRNDLLIEFSDSYDSLLNLLEFKENEIKDLQTRNTELVDVNGRMLSRITKESLSTEDIMRGERKKFSYDDLISERGDIVG